MRDGADDNIRLHFIVGRPRNPSLGDACRDAVEIIRHVPFENEVFKDDSIGEIEKISVL